MSRFLQSETLRAFGWKTDWDNKFITRNTEAIPGRVLMESRTQFIVQSDEGEIEAKIRGKMRHTHAQSETPTVGDWILWKQDDSDERATIVDILPRQNFVFRRQASGWKRNGPGKLRRQVMSANVDRLFIVAGLDREFNLGRIERYISMAESSLIPPVILLNKADLCKDADKQRKKVESVAHGIPVLVLSALEEGAGDLVAEQISVGETALLAGSSGVGKSSILNNILGHERQVVHDLSDFMGKGQHTTTHRELIPLPNGGLLIDNPGMKELQLWAPPEVLRASFVDLEEMAANCKFSDCRHEFEPGCAVREAIDSGLVEERRVQNYQKLLNELKQLEKQKTMAKKNRF